MAYSAENILTLINTRVETAGGAPIMASEWSPGTPFLDRQRSDDTEHPRDDVRDAGRRSRGWVAFRPRTSPRRRALRDAGRFTNGMSARPDWHLASSAGGPSFTNERRLAAFVRRSAAYDERPARRAINKQSHTIGTKPAPEHARRADAAPSRRAPTYETKRTVRYLRAALSHFEDRPELGALSGARVTRTRF